MAELEAEAGGLEFLPCNWIIAAIGFVVFLSFLWLNRISVRPVPPRESPHNSLCGSPSCARCGRLPTLTQKLRHRFDVFFNSDSVHSSYSNETKDRVFSLITESVENKDVILSTTYAESGYILNEEEVNALPHIWMLPGLCRFTFWKTGMDRALREIASMFEETDNFRGIQRDFGLVYGSDDGWKVNSVPSGKWRVYHLYDQGEEVVRNSSRCPFTSELLRATPLFMSCHVFGNAMFSVLEPGSSIEPHTGPCNYRLRCHLSLVAPPGYRLKVGRDTSEWKEGELMIFDDSFVHEVWHKEVELTETEPGAEPTERRERETQSRAREKLTENLERAVLIFDIWHPHLTREEQAAIKYVYDD